MRVCLLWRARHSAADFPIARLYLSSIFQPRHDYPYTFGGGPHSKAIPWQARLRGPFQYCAESRRRRHIFNSAGVSHVASLMCLLAD